MQKPGTWPSSLITRLRSLIVALVVIALSVEGPLRGAGGLPAWVSVGGTSAPAGTVLPGEQQGDPVLAAAKRKRAKKRDKQRADEEKGRKASKKSKQDNEKNQDKDDRKRKAKRDGRGKERDSNRNAHKKGKSKQDNERDGQNPKDGKRPQDKRNDVKRGDGKRDRRERSKHRSSDTEATARIASASAPLTFVPVADAQVNEANPNYNYGARPRLLVDGGKDPTIAAYVRFDVSGVTAPVQQATLRLRVRDNNGTRDGPELHATGTDWAESGITWNDRPSVDGILDDTEKLDEGSWAEYDVTSAVRGDGPVGFALLPQSSDGVYFQSREGERSPELVVTLQEPTPLPSPEPSPLPTSEPDSTPTPEPTAPSEPTVPSDSTATPEPTAEPTSTSVPTPTPEPTATQTPSPTTGPHATLLAAGDIASCSSNGDEATAALLDRLPGTVATLGDSVYESGTAKQFAECYAPTWGRHLARTRPALGNHEYLTSGASGYFGYFAPVVQANYYSYDLGTWHIVVLDSNCSEAGGCGAGSAQEKWLRQDLAANPTSCTLAYWHHPRYSFGEYSNDARTRDLWQALYDHGAEIVLAGHDHNYQRYAPQDSSGNRDAASGIRQFVVGTGGKGHYRLGNPPPNVQASNDDTFGVLQLALHSDSYEWEFVPEAGKNYSDTGSDDCH